MNSRCSPAPLLKLYILIEYFQAFSSDAYNDALEYSDDDLGFDGGFDLADLVGSANFNVTDADVTEDNDGETAPGNPLDPEDFAKAMSESYDAPLLDEVPTYFQGFFRQFSGKHKQPVAWNLS